MPVVTDMFGDPAASAIERAAGALSLDPACPPLHVDEGGVVRVGNTRISLDLIVHEYDGGMTAEDIVRGYDTLELADVYAVIGWYLRHKDPVALT
jgi:uncharacterized protein (DUF433 family)